MSYQSRPSLYPSTHAAAASLSASSSQQSSALQARIAAKCSELQHLKELRDLSATLAAQMAQLEAKLGTLRDGTEAVACVMANWDGVLKAISMAGAKVASAPAGEAAEQSADTKRREELPQTLVRIPVGQQLQQQEQPTAEDSAESEVVSGG